MTAGRPTVQGSFRSFHVRRQGAERAVAIIVTGWLESWRSCSLSARLVIVVLFICAIEATGVVIYSFLLPMTG